MLVQEFADFAILHLDIRGNILSWNKGAELILGFTADEIVGQHFSVIFSPEDKAGGVPEEILTKVAETGRVEDRRRLQRKDVSGVQAGSLINILKDESGVLKGFGLIVRPETDRQQAEANRERSYDLVEQEQLDGLNADIGNILVQDLALRELLSRCTESLVKHLDAAFARIWTLNRDENVLELQASAGMYTHLDGAHARVPVGKFKIGLIAEERLPHLTNDILNDPRLSDKKWAKREGIKSFAGYPLIVEDQLAGVMCVFAKHFLTEAALQAMASVSNGIANGIERKRYENALRQSEEQYRIVAETASDAIISIDEKSTILFINRAAEKIFGYEIAEMIGQNLTMLMPEYLRKVHQAGLEKYNQTGVKHLQWDYVEVPGLHRQGHEFPLELSFGEYKKDDQHIFIGIARDVSDRKRAEAQFLESEQKFSTLADAVPQLVWMGEADGHIFWYNRNWYKYTGTMPEDMEGWGWQTVHDPEILPKVIKRWKHSIENGEQFEMQFPLRGADGKFRWFLTRVNPLRDAEGKVVRWFGTNTDIDEQRKVDQRNRFFIRLDENVRSLETPEEVTLTLSRLLGEYLNADLCAYAEIEADENHFIILGDYTRSNISSIVGRYKLSDFGETALEKLRANQPFIINDVNTDERISEADLKAYKMLSVRSVICFPLHKNNRFVACMSINQSTPRQWQPEEIELVSFVSNRFWESIERARAYRSLQESLMREKEARQSAEEANKIKDEFLATVSHELRTPLNAILGWATLLRNGKLGGDASDRAIETVERNARAQSQLIDDLLDISRIISGKLRLEIQTLDLATIIEAAVEAVRPAAEAKEIRLQILLDTKAGPVSGDANRLQQVFWNLLSNAVKFTPKHGRVQVCLERVNSHLEITISDTGKGIKPEFLPHVFDRFRQADQTTTRRQGGLGLGLSIVRQLVEMHGGTVYAESEGEGKGTNFIVSLPRSVVANRIKQEKHLRPLLPKEFVSFDCAPELTGMQILVVDDEADARELLREVLEICGSEVTTTSSAAEALATMESATFDILISDIGMPAEDGYSLIKKIRARPTDKNGRIPAIALTAYARVEDRVRALTAGFQLHIPKPVEPVELIAVVASLVNGFKKQ